MAASGCLLCVLLKTRNIVLKPKEGLPTYLHFFPKDPNWHVLWERTICEQFPQAKVNISSKICSLHFREDAFVSDQPQRIKLKDSAVPVVEFPWDIDERSQDGDELNPLGGIVIPLETIPIPRKLNRPQALPQCVICNLLKTWNIAVQYNEPVSYHAFPNDQLRSDMWVKKITDKFPNATVIDKRLAVCSMHFPKSAFVEGRKNRVLKFSAMPVLHSFDYCITSKKKKITAESPSSTSNDRAPPLKKTIAPSFTTSNQTSETTVIKIEDSDSDETPSIVKESSTPSPKSYNLNLPCGECEKTFSSKNEFLEHKFKKHKEYNGKYYAQLLDVHKYKPRGTNNLKCRICKKMFGRQILLFEHLKCHCRFSCNTCSMVFTEKKLFDLHNATHCNSYKCKKCAVVTTDIKAANNHKCVEHKCDMCDFTCSQATQLSIHEKQHLQIRNDEVVYECLVCKKQFQLKIDLVAHRATHNREKDSAVEIVDTENEHEISSKRKSIEEESTHPNNQDSKDWFCDNSLAENDSLPIVSPLCPRISIKLKPSSQSAITEVIDLEIKTEDPQVIETDIPAKPVDQVKNRKNYAKRDLRKVKGQDNLSVVDEVEVPTIDLDSLEENSEHSSMKEEDDVTEPTTSPKVKLQVHPKVVDDLFCEVCQKHFTIDWRLDDHRRNEHGIGLNFKRKTKSTSIKQLPASIVGEAVPTIDLKSLEENSEPKSMEEDSVPEPASKKALSIDNLVDSHPEKPEFAEVVQSDGYDSDVWPMDNNPWPQKCVDVKTNGCEICNYEHFFETRSALLYHKSKVHGISSNVMYYCDKCVYQNESKSKLRQHMITWHKAGKRQHECDHCGRNFKNELLLKHHSIKYKSQCKAKTGFGIFSCSTCDLRFINNFECKLHHDNHRGFYECPVCKKVNNSREQAQSHVYKCTQPILYCDECDYRSRNPHGLQSHKQSHSRTLYFSCDHCSKMFTSKGQRNIHQNLHTGERPYKCNVCPLAFADPSTLRKHKRTHITQQLSEEKGVEENISGIRKPGGKAKGKLLKASVKNTVEKSMQEITAKIGSKVIATIKAKLKAKPQNNIVEENDTTSEDHEKDDDDDNDDQEVDQQSKIDNETMSDYSMHEGESLPASDEADEKSSSHSEVKENGRENAISNDEKSNYIENIADTVPVTEDDEWIEEWLE